jgi:hypothetical protein
MKKLLFFAAVFCLGFSSVAQEDTEFRKDLMEFVEAQSGGTMDAALDQVMAMIPADKHEAFMKDVKAKMPSMYEQSADLYLKILGKEDLKKMFEFYETPAGQRILEKTPELTSKGIEMGQQWAMTNLQPILQKYMGQ